VPGGSQFSVSIVAQAVLQDVRTVPDDVVIRFVDPATEPGWHSRIAHLPGVTLYHGSAWSKVLGDSYGFNARHAIAESEGVPCGLLPVMEVDNWPKGRRGISLPFTDEAPLLAANATVRQRLANAVLDEGKNRRWKYVEARGSIQAFSGAQPSVSFYNHRLILHPDERQLFAECSSAARRGVRKASHLGLSVAISNSLDAMYSFYRLHLKTRRKHGIPPQSFAFFKHLHRRILECGHGFVTTASVGKRPVAAAVFLTSGNNAVYKFGASDEEFQQSRGNNLAMWESIRWLARNGFVELDFGRTSLDNAGLRRFKLGWGTTESRIDYCKYDFAAQRFISDVDLASRRYSQVFRLLPNSLCRRLGALVYSRSA
jgi:CelD/BcsL family acetyltransferase involved in cellulose biosynthesis